MPPSRTPCGTPLLFEIDLRLTIDSIIVIQHPAQKKKTHLFVYDETGQLIWSQKLTANATNIQRSQVARSGNFVYTIAENQQITLTKQFVFR